MSRLRLTILAAGTFAVGMDGFILAGLLPAVAVDLAVSLPVAGQLTTIFALSYAIGAPVIAAWTGHLSRRPVLLGGLVLFMIGMIAQAAGPDFAVVAIGRLLAGVGAATFQPAAFQAAGHLVPANRRGRALALVAAGISLSMVIGVPFGVLAGQLWGWRGPLWIVAGIAFVVAVLCVFLPQLRIPSAGLRERMSALFIPRILRVLLTSSLMIVSGFAVISFIPSVLGEGAGSAVVVVGLLSFGVGEVVGLRLIGVLIDRFGPLDPLFWGAAGTTLVFTIFVFLPPGVITAILVFSVLGFFAGLISTPQQMRLLTIDPPRSSVALGLNGSAIYLGTSIGAVTGGLALAWAGAQGVLIWAAFASMLAWIGAWLLAPERAVARRASTPFPLLPLPHSSARSLKGTLHD